jgi:hypothetical protein
LPSLDRGGGLAMVWKNEVDIRLQSLDKLHVNVAVLDSETHCEKFKKKETHCEKGDSLISRGI